MLNAALAGLGWWGRTIDALLAGSRKLRVVRRVDPMVREPGIGADLGEALRDPAVQAVILCTPHSLHAQQIVQAASAGKHVFCEKPLALSRADALKAIRTINEKNLVLAVGHEKRFEPPIQELFRLAKSGALGTPLQIEANFS